MSSKIQKHMERRTRLEARIGKLKKIHNAPLRFLVKCGDGYMREAATVMDDGRIELSPRSLTRETSRDLATWILEQHAGHVEPPAPPKEDTPS